MQWQLARVDERQFRCVLQGGLGPLLQHATREQPDVVPVSWREHLQSEALTARMRHAARIDVAREVIELCTRQGIPVTLLKGISTSEQFYPAGHLRPMADVDVLVAPTDCGRVETRLRLAGYRPAEDFPDSDELHHGPPLRHGVHDVWIEIHRSLFPPRDEYAVPSLFRPESVAANSEASRFHGLPARRLAPELQLIYIASSWMRDLMHSGIHPSFLASMFDAILLVARTNATFDWANLLRLTGDDMPTAALQALLAYLEQRALVELPPALVGELAARHTVAGALQLRIIHAVLDRHLIGGRPWRYPIPLPVVGRYGIRRQWNKRVLRRR